MPWLSAVPEVASNALSAAAAYYSWKVSERKVISRECEWAELIIPNEKEIDLLSDETISAIGRHTRNVDKYCTEKSPK